MKPPIYCTFDVFLENYLENFIEANKYEGINIQEYNYTLLFEYGSIAKHLPFNDDELQQEKEYIEKKFGIFQLIFLIDEYDVEGRILTLENTRKVSKILRRQAFKIANYLKNELLKKEIETVETSTSSYLEKKNGKLHALLESHLMTESNWIRFKREFEKEFPDFSQNLITNFPELTDSNKRIIFLQKLGFSNIEISQSLGITTDAVKKAKQRLKKKLGGHQDLLLLFTQKETTKT